MELGSKAPSKSVRVRVLGAQSMTAISRQQGNQFLVKKSPQYIERVNTKMRAYQTHIQLGTIAQGLVVMLSY